MSLWFSSLQVTAKRRPDGAIQTFPTELASYFVKINLLLKVSVDHTITIGLVPVSPVTT